ncbi:alanyl-tRNA editing protein [Pseudescherichia sp.]|uniref:alanyl-tRNA editing protein n=1 Tax=Pseudescherichia sp. TaxID=2055881 RepID=UPI0028AE66EB|nr:alanyl-tRNA editing protein [Pseudescherichia sp.]
MTERLYYTSDATQGVAKVLSCIEEPDGRYAIVLDKTLFHPQGGGQPADAGRIGNVNIESVIQRGESVIHILPAPLASGETTLHVDAETRALHSRWHSAGHLIGYAAERHGWQPVKAHHWPGEGKVTFIAGEGADVPDSDMLLASIEAWISAGLLRHVEFESDRRKVRFGDLPAYQCGGTHVPNLQNIDKLVIGSIKQKKGQLTISYLLP